MSLKQPAVVLAAVFVGAMTVATALSQGPPPPRRHTVVSRGELNLLPASSRPPGRSAVSITVEDDVRVIRSNGIPDHGVGRFPNAGNPNRISEQDRTYRVPAEPTIEPNVSSQRGMFGIAVNGVPFDPGAAEFYDGQSGWRYEPLSGAIDLGIDMSHAHVQPTGKYHYHGLPSGLLENVSLQPGRHSPLIGWAADGFPIYALYGHKDAADKTSPVVELTSSYRLRAGERPGGDAPGGTFDGTFVADYEYIAGSGDLDECNGRQTVTPEFPNGTYAYFLTQQWPVIPRVWRGTPSADFLHGPPGGGAERGDHPGPRPRGRDGRAGNGGPRLGAVLPPSAAEQLRLTREQRAEVEALEATVRERLESILTPRQQRQLRQMGPPRGRPPRR